MKKRAIIIVLILAVVGIFSIKYFTTLLDSKDSAIIVNKHFPFNDDYQDKRKLTNAVDHIFIGEVIREVGNKAYTRNPNTQFLVRITQNIKGALLGDITVNQEGGYYKEIGELYLLTYEKSPLLKKDQMYLFFLTSTNNGYFEMMPKYGSMLLDNEDEKLKQIDAVRKVMKEN
ncbi:hypothetical protein J7E79_12265 [Bacillus sp. ISL-40]|uniref:hypothetical protein n=1 Tax=unclassified Bacillus (in: firmicutes) TaxID=185979 RepID=UPI001BECC952|nr:MULTISPECIES: hypothetical protein [unclassified Bacillus (in: firmicutes)]MBT2698189.1 hypothetical protein [Bacillus sp. ISL-40]MBT2741989.1 hypothetical protein [Bacillus sp. ISL-77]